MGAAKLERIVSGGQSGVDRGALDAALDLGIGCGGWCPRGRWAEDGPIPERYPLRETEEADPAVRTDLNVRDSDGTLIVSPGPLGGGTELTRRCAIERGRPHLVIDPAVPDLRAVRAWIARHRITVLNVAGPRESRCPGIAGATRNLVDGLLSPPGDDA